VFYTGGPLPHSGYLKWLYQRVYNLG